MTTKALKEIMEQAAAWPPEDQNELAEYAREIEARRTGVYTMLDEARCGRHRFGGRGPGEFVCDELVQRPTA